MSLSHSGNYIRDELWGHRETCVHIGTQIDCRFMVATGLSRRRDLIAQVAAYDGSTSLSRSSELSVPPHRCQGEQCRLARRVFSAIAATDSVGRTREDGSCPWRKTMSPFRRLFLTASAKPDVSGFAPLDGPQKEAAPPPLSLTEWSQLNRPPLDKSGKQQHLKIGTIHALTNQQSQPRAVTQAAHDEPETAGEQPSPR